MEELRNINSRLELFVDDWLIEKMNGVSLQMHSPIPQEVVLEFNQPWEGSISYDPVVMKEGNRYRLCGSESTWEDQCTAYAAQMVCIGNVRRWESLSSTATGKTTSFFKGARRRHCVHPDHLKYDRCRNCS